MSVKRWVRESASHIEAIQEQISQEWDDLAPIREEQLASGEDESFHNVLLPWVLEKTRNANSVIDVGCGTGYLTSRLRAFVPSVVGIDPSTTSISIAKEKYVDINFHVSTVEDWAVVNECSYDLVVANMVLMDLPNLQDALEAAAKLSRGGRFIFTVTHPAFWPKYWGYENDKNFNYQTELMIEQSFRTRSREYKARSRHFHRPIAQYFGALHGAGFVIEGVDELRGPELPEDFPFPRFLAIECSVSNSEGKGSSQSVSQ